MRTSDTSVKGVLQQQLELELMRRMLMQPARTFVPHSPSQQALISSTIRGVVFSPGGNQSGKTQSLIGVKASSVAEGYHHLICCPTNCPQYGVGSCGLHCCPSDLTGSVTSCSAAGRPVACHQHRPLSWPKPRRILIVSMKFNHLYDLVYEHTLKPMLSKTISGALTWREPSRSRGEHQLVAHNGDYIITLASYEEGKKDVAGKRVQLLLFDELPPYSVWQEAMPRVWYYDGQIGMVATPDRLLDDNVDGLWLYPELIERKDPGIQVLPLSTLDNPSIDRDRVERDAARLSEEALEIRVKGGLTFRKTRCLFEDAVLDTVKTTVRPGTQKWLLHSDPPTEGEQEWINYVQGPTRFPRGCPLLPPEQMEIQVRKSQANTGGVACVDCLRRCPLYQPPPVSQRNLDKTPELVERWPERLAPEHDHPRLLIWNEPSVGRSYGLFCDVAQGVRGGDYNAGTLLDLVTGEQAAELSGRWKPYTFAYYLRGIHKIYNDAVLVVEGNNHGMAVVDTLQQLGVANLYGDPERDLNLASGDSVPYPAVLTTPANKPTMISQLSGRILSGEFTVRSPQTLVELRNYVRQISTGGRVTLGAVRGTNDDRVSSLLVAAHSWDHLDRSGFLIAPKERVERLTEERALARDADYLRWKESSRRRRGIDGIGR